MGNDNSRLKGLIVNKKSVENNQFWTLNDAELPATSSEDEKKYLSIMQEEPMVYGQLWAEMSPLARVINNLKIYRHPHILRYVNTWSVRGQKFLATERVRPLNSIIKNLSDIEICIGIRSILCSLIFLVEKANARHLNICIESIYVTDSGAWRLSGFEYVWKSSQLTNSLLEKLLPHREKSAVDVNELKDTKAQNTIEQYAFANMCQEILGKCTPSKNHILEKDSRDFCDYCATQLKNPNYELRPSLSEILQHTYFNNDLVLIHSFIFELPAKSVEEKHNFFTHLIERLSQFDEETIGKHLAGNLISHMVLLDATAQLCVTPFVMRTKTSSAFALFSPNIYVKYLLPHILKMFRIRDAQIRMILLEYFLEYVRMLDEHDVRQLILPQLEAGMNDVNDLLVAKTMHCLADLVPILGAEVVIGGARSRIFSDGRPCGNLLSSGTGAQWKEHRSISPLIGGDENEYMMSNSPVLKHETKVLQDVSNDLSIEANTLTFGEEAEKTTDAEGTQLMPPRMSPDGGEDESSSIMKKHLLQDLGAHTTQFIDNTNDDVISQTEVWSDWEDDAEQSKSKVQVVQENNAQYKQKAPQNKTIIDDLSALDLQVKRDTMTETTGLNEEFDYFKDMVPDIIFSKQKIQDDEPKLYSSRLGLSPNINDANDDDDNAGGDGWIIDCEDELIVN